MFLRSAAGRAFRSFTTFASNRCFQVTLFFDIEAPEDLPPSPLAALAGCFMAPLVCSVVTSLLLLCLATLLAFTTLFGRTGSVEQRWS